MMFAKKLATSLLAMIVFLAAPLMLGAMYIALYTSGSLDTYIGIGISACVVSAFLFYVLFSEYFAGACYSVEGIKNQNGWIWILIIVFFVVVVKVSMLSLIEESSYFAKHVKENRDLPSSPNQYSFSASDEDVCFSLKQNRRRSAKYVEWYCYERNLKD